LNCAAEICDCEINVKIIIGLCEESLPKGWGYFFWRSSLGGHQIRVCDCDLFDTAPEVVQPLICRVISSIEDQLGMSRDTLSRCEFSFDNLSPVATGMFRDEIENRSPEMRS
jgi:hypothetical protein